MFPQPRLQDVIIISCYSIIQKNNLTFFIIIIFDILIDLQENGILIESMDACFGLSRKKRQGQKSVGVPKHAQLMFADQTDVHNFVNSYCARASDVSKVCYEKLGHTKFIFGNS